MDDEKCITQNSSFPAVICLFRLPYPKEKPTWQKRENLYPPQLETVQKNESVIQLAEEKQRLKIRETGGREREHSAATTHIAYCNIVSRDALSLGDMFYMYDTETPGTNRYFITN